MLIGERNVVLAGWNRTHEDVEGGVRCGSAIPPSIVRSASTVGVVGGKRMYSITLSVFFVTERPFFLPISFSTRPTTIGGHLDDVTGDAVECLDRFQLSIPSRTVS